MEGFPGCENFGTVPLVSDEVLNGLIATVEKRKAQKETLTRVKGTQGSVNQVVLSKEFEERAEDLADLDPNGRILQHSVIKSQEESLGRNGYGT